MREGEREGGEGARLNKSAGPLQLRVMCPTPLKLNTWHSVNARNEKSRGKKSRTAKFDVCIIGI